jgi:hypothetical protein
MKKTMMYLPDELHRYLAREAKARGSSMAEIAREAITEYRGRHLGSDSTSLGSLFGVLSDTDTCTDLATSVDETLDDYYAPGGTWEGEHRDASAD